MTGSGLGSASPSRRRPRPRSPFFDATLSRARWFLGVAVVALACLQYMSMEDGKGFGKSIRGAAATVTISVARSVGGLIRPSCYLKGGEPLRPASGRSSDFGLAFYDTRKHLAYREASVENKLEYCEAHGYFCYDGSDAATSDATSYLKRSNVKEKEKITMYTASLSAKVNVVLRALEKCPHCEWVLFTDIDLIIMNFGISIPELLRGIAADDYFVIAADSLTLNTGSWLVRNSEKGKELLREWARMQVNYKTNQQAFNALYNARAECKGKDKVEDLSHSGSVVACINTHVPGIAVVPLCGIGSWGGLEWSKGGVPYMQGMYVDGDFAVHFAGRGAEKVKLIAQALGGEHFWS